MIVRALLLLAIGAAGISTNLAAQIRQVQAEAVVNPRDIPPHLYREPMTRNDVTPDWRAFTRLHSAALSEEMFPGRDLGLASRYGLTGSEAGAALQAVREVMAEMDHSWPKPRSICSAEISSSQEYVGWWARFDAQVRAHRVAMVEALVSRLETPVWEAIIQREFLEWLAIEEEIGNKINRQKQVEAADYRVWIRGMCGER